MKRIYIFGCGDDARAMVTWLKDSADISSHDVAAVIDYSPLPAQLDAREDGVPIIDFPSVKASLAPDDVVLVVGERFGDAVADLLALGVRYIVDGRAVLRSTDAAAKLLRLTRDFRVTQSAASSPVHTDRDFQRYVAPARTIEDLSPNRTFIVNSMPKSGSVWMIGLLEDLLGAESGHRVVLSHVMDIETDLVRSNLHGVVVLVRDMRDVVVSWFHHVARLDMQNGFAVPRYPTIEEFYFDHFIGAIFASPRYGYGNFEQWLDLAGLHGFPVIRYEQLVDDAASALARVMNFWKLHVPAAELDRVVRDCTFENMRVTHGPRSTFVGEMLRAGHLRRGKVGAWQEELPGPIAQDVNTRFAHYQSRLGYV